MAARLTLLIGILMVGTSYAEDANIPTAVPLYNLEAFHQDGEPSHQPTPLQHFVELMQQQDWTRARILVNEILDQYEGLPRFDLYYGILLIQERAYDLAILPLERVLLFTPNQHRARIELGRAYFLLSNYVRAKNELNQVLAMNPPSNIKAKAKDILAAIDRAQMSQDITNVVSVSLLVGWDSNANGGSSVTETLDSNLSDITALSNDPSPVNTRFGQWSVNYALIKPTSQTSSQRLLFDYTNTLYSEPEYPTSHSFTLGGYLFEQQSRKRSTLPITAVVDLSNNRLSQLTFDASYQLDFLAWGPLWTGIKIGSQPSVSLVDTTPTSIKDTLGFVLSATERGRMHTFQSQYVQMSLAGQDDEHNEWRGMVNRYTLSWPIQANMNFTGQFEHQWRTYKDDDQFFTINEGSTKLKRRQDQVITLDNEFNWQINKWLQSQSHIAFERLDSNINAYQRNRLIISQALSVQF